MATEIEHLQKADSSLLKNTVGDQPGVDVEAPVVTDYMQLTVAAQRLRFPASVEAEFKTDYYRSTISTTRWAFVAGLIIYLLYGYLDFYVAPFTYRQMLAIRFGLVCPVLLMVVVITFIKQAAPLMQLVSAVAAIISGIGLAAIIYVSQPGELAYTQYYSGFLLVMLFTSSWLRLRFWYALTTNTIIIITYEWVAVNTQQLLASSAGRTLLLSNNFLLLGTYVIGAFANYWLERHTRINFLQNRTIEAEKSRVTAQREAIEEQAQKLSKVIASLKKTQSRLVHSEKLASLGELTVGIAHEIKNPLNFVTNFSEVSMELITDLEEEVAAGNKEETIELAKNIKENLEKIAYHGNRADSIVKNMLQHSRKGTGQKELADINSLVDEYLRLSYQGFRAKDKNFNCTIDLHLDNSIGKINIVVQDIGRVLLNLFTNAFYSLNEKKKKLGAVYNPVIAVSTQLTSSSIFIRVKDNGLGISQKARAKIFQPFFTTKPTGEGIGLGLSLSHDIITKGHNGTLKIETEEGEFAEFIIHLPA